MRLLECQIETLWTREADGTLLVTNEPWPTPAPRLFVGRDEQGYLVRTGQRLLPETRAVLLGLPAERLFAEQALVMGLLGPNDEQALGPHDAPTEAPALFAGPSFVFEQRVPDDAFPDARLLDAGDTALLDAYAPGHAPGHAAAYLACAPICGALADGAIAAVCHSSRITVAAHEAGLETAPAFRRRGLGRQAVLGWAHAVQALGALALYSTGWENAASQGVARSLGLRQYAETVSYY